MARRRTIPADPDVERFVEWRRFNVERWARVTGLPVDDPRAERHVAGLLRCRARWAPPDDFSREQLRGGAA